MLEKDKSNVKNVLAGQGSGAGDQGSVVDGILLMSGC
jgi:hypothetical protein